MGKIVAEYEGSKAGTIHNIIRGDDGVVYCTCWAWKKNRTCKHLDRFFAGVKIGNTLHDQTSNNDQGRSCGKS